jgi:hypothetical protein
MRRNVGFRVLGVQIRAVTFSHQAVAVEGQDLVDQLALPRTTPPLSGTTGAAAGELNTTSSLRWSSTASIS